MFCESGVRNVLWEDFLHIWLHSIYMLFLFVLFANYCNFFVNCTYIVETWKAFFPIRKNKDWTCMILFKFGTIHWEVCVLYSTVTFTHPLLTIFFAERAECHRCAGWITAGHATIVKLRDNATKYLSFSDAKKYEKVS